MSAGRNKNSKTRLRKYQRLEKRIGKFEHRAELRKRRKLKREKQQLLKAK